MIEQLIRDSERLCVAKAYIENYGGQFIDKDILLVILGEAPKKADAE